MENALTNDSSLVWQATGAGFYDLDLGADYTIGLMAALGQRGSPWTTAGISSIVTKYSSTANGYPPVSLNPWTTFGTITMGAGVRRAVVGTVGVVALNVRYVRFDITASTAFTLGRIFVGSFEYDLGQIASPGRRRRRILPRLRNEVGANPTISRVAEDYFQYELDYDHALDALFAKLEAVATQNQPALMIETDGSAHEVVLTDDTFEESLMFDSPNQRNAGLRLRTLA
jgi:hypothetical protein